MAYIGSLDQGTSSTRFIVFDGAGKIVGQHQLEHTQFLPQAGWVEHDAAEIWKRTEDVIAGALKAARISGSDLVAIGITNQRETTVVWDKTTGAPLSHAIVWQDTSLLFRMPSTMVAHLWALSIRGCSGIYREAPVAESISPM